MDSKALTELTFIDCSTDFLTGVGPQYPLYQLVGHNLPAPS